MTNVIAPHVPSWGNSGRFFVLACRQVEDGGWTIDIIDFHDASMKEPDVFREIADTLISVSGGMIHNAEQIDPTERGERLINLSISSDNTCDLVGKPVDTEERVQWLADIFDKLINELRVQLNPTS